MQAAFSALSAHSSCNEGLYDSKVTREYEAHMQKLNQQEKLKIPFSDIRKGENSAHMVIKTARGLSVGNILKSFVT